MDSTSPPELFLVTDSCLIVDIYKGTEARVSYPAILVWFIVLNAFPLEYLYALITLL